MGVGAAMVSDDWVVLASLWEAPTVYFEVIPQHSLEKVKKTMKNPYQDSYR
jgi:hypothetical protein